ncbi:MAG: type II secretion system protein GspD, partial [Pseudomonadales bacterium]
HIQDGGTLRLEIHQEVSEIDTASLNAIGTQGSADLITNKRTIDTTIVVDDQEVIIIGGLIRDKETLIDSRVPVLGRIPLIGALFRSKSTDIEKQHLLVFIRPTILKSREAVAEVTKREFLDLYEVEIEGRDPADAISDLFDGKAP